MIENYKEKFKKITEENIDVEKNKKWDIYDSGLVSGENPLEFDFLKLYPRGFKNIKDYLEKEYKKEKGKIYGIELGGPGSRLFADFSSGFIKKSFGITLFDHRTEDQKIKDNERNHQILTLDIFDENTYEIVKELADQNNFHLLFERMEGGWVNFPQNLEAFEFLLFKWYSLLKDQGVMFVQSPYVFEKKHLDEWNEWFDFNKLNLGLDKSVFDYVYEGGRFYIKVKKDPQKPIRFLIKD